MHTYTDPTGETHDAIPQTWHHNGISHAFAGDWSRAKRLGWTREEAEPGPFRITKLRLRRAMRAIGMEQALDAAIESLGTEARHDYDDAHDIASDDPMLLASLPVVAAATEKTEEEAMAMLRAAAEAEGKM